MSTNPRHYARLDPEPIVVIERWGLGFCLGNAVKYISRAGHKPGADALEDLAKARWYLERAARGVVSESTLETEAERWEIVARQQARRIAQLEVQLIEAGMTELRDSRPEFARTLPEFDTGGES